MNTKIGHHSCCKQAEKIAKFYVSFLNLLALRYIIRFSGFGSPLFPWCNPSLCPQTRRTSSKLGRKYAVSDINVSAFLPLRFSRFSFFAFVARFFLGSNKNTALRTEKRTLFPTNLFFAAGFSSWFLSFLLLWTLSVLLLKVGVCNFAWILEVKICTEKLANPLEESHKNTSFFEFTNVRPAARPPGSTIRNYRFCRIFNDIGFEWLQKLKLSISLRVLLGAPSLSTRVYSAP